MRYGIYPQSLLIGLLLWSCAIQSSMPVPSQNTVDIVAVCAPDIKTSQEKLTILQADLKGIRQGDIFVELESKVDSVLKASIFDGNPTTDEEKARYDAYLQCITARLSDTSAP